MKNVTLYDLQLLSIHQFFSTCMYVVFCSSSSSSSSIALQGAWLLVFFGTTTGTTRRFCSSSGWFRWAGVMGVMGVMLKNCAVAVTQLHPCGLHFACLGRSVDGFVVPGSWVVVVLRGIGGLSGAEGTSCRSRWVVVCWFCVRACPRALCVMGGMRSCSCAFGSSGHQNGASRARER